MPTNHTTVIITVRVRFKYGWLGAAAWRLWLCWLECAYTLGLIDGAAAMHYAEAATLAILDVQMVKPKRGRR